MNIREYVATLSVETMKQIMVDYGQYEKDCCIGESTLRHHVEHVAKMLGLSPYQFGFMVELLIKEIYRVGAYQHFQMI